MKLTALVPIKTHSERVPNKNLRLFNGVPLFTIILHTLEKCSSIDKIIVNTDNENVKEYIRKNLPRTIATERPQNLIGDMVVMNELIEHDISLLENEHFIQTHCTNPLLTESSISEAINKYITSMAAHDSLISVTKIQARTYWGNGEPINHELTNMERTQDLNAVYEENSNFFIFSKNSFRNSGKSRVGQRPQLFELNRIEAIDIDYEADFLLAELIHRNKSLFQSVF